jgi:hypothetical protein
MRPYTRKVEDSAVGRPPRHGTSSEAHVGKEADTERGRDIHGEPAAFLLNNDLQRSLLSRRPHRRLGRGLPPQTAGTSLLVDPARRYLRGDAFVEFISPRQRAG